MARFRMLVLVAGIAALVAGGSAFGAPAKVKLKGGVGPGFTITLKDATGKPVRTLKAGAYAIEVTDRSSIHNFELEGPGVDREITGVGFMGTKTALVTLKKGTYTFYCAPHEGSMKGSFKVV